MKMSRYLSRMGAKNAELRVLKLVLVGIGVCTLLNTWILYRALSSRHTVLVPAGGLSEEASVTNGSADPKYLRMMVTYVANLMWNYTPANARRQFEEVLALYDSDGYANHLKDYVGMADDVEYSRMTSVFNVSEMTFRADGDFVTVKGDLRQYIDDKLVENRTALFELAHEVRDGRFYLKGIREQKG
ncbi:MAG: TraE/TraK family type IV conjugative transfer system protein [Candidatus Eisenbacteria bacterium]